MKKKMKSIMAVILVLVMTFMLSACGGGDNNQEGNDEPDKKKGSESEDDGSSDDKAFKIAVLIPGPTGYFVATKEGVDAAAAEAGAQIEYADAEWDASKQLSQAEDFIAKGVDMIALCCVDSASGEKIIKSANEADIPIVAFVNAVGEEETGEYEGLVSYIGQNEVNTGAVTGQLAKSFLADGGKAVLIEGVPGTTPQINRKKGLETELEGSGIEIVYNQTSNWEKEEALKIVEDLIQKKMDFDIVICQDDNSATGAGQALKEAGLKEDVKVIGLGGSIDGLEAVKSGLIDGTTYMSAVEEGRTAIETGIKFLKGDTVEAVTEIKQVEVNPENVEEFKGEW